MATEPEGNDFADRCNQAMSSDYGIRAGSALTRLVPGPHRDKNIARIFGCSVRTAKYLRAGLHWTTDRLSQAGMLIKGFDMYLAAPSAAQIHDAIDDLQRRIDELQEQLGQRGDE